MRPLMLFRRFVCVAAVALSIAAAGKANAFDFARLTNPTYRVPDRTFPECCAEPAWWASAETAPIRSIEDLYALWQNRGVQDRVKAKAFFQAVRDFQGRDDEIVATAIALYPNVDRKYPDLVALLEYGVSRYFDYDGSHDHYVGPPADRSAGLVRHLGRQYQNDGWHEQAVKLVAAFMARREAETNPHMKQLLSMLMARSLDELGQTRTADKLLAHAEAYEGSWNMKIAEQRSALREKLPLFDRLPANLLYYGLAAVLLFAGAATLLIRRRQAHA